LNEAVNAYSIESDPKSDGSATLQQELDALIEMDQILGVFDLEIVVGSGDLDVSQINSLIEARLTARDEKEWGRADEIRSELLKMGVAINDGPDGTTWSKIVQ